MTDALTLVPAGAGSGKTYRIKTDLTEWVKSGVVRPDRILAVTFTEADRSGRARSVANSLRFRGMLRRTCGAGAERARGRECGKARSGARPGSCGMAIAG